MRKVTFFVFSALFLTLLTIACDDQKTMQEYIREENKAIERYIQKQDIKIAKDYPSIDEFKKNEKLYYKTSGSTYVYFHVVEQGVDTVVLPRQEVVVRNDYFYYIKDYITGDTLHNEVPSLFSPMSFVFGIPESYVADKAGLACVGWAIPLSSQYKLKKGAIIDLIIPSVSGNSSDNAAFRPVFYKHLQYSDFGPIDIAI